MLVFCLLITSWLLNTIACITITITALILLNYIENKRLKSEKKIIKLNNALTERMQHHTAELVETVVKLEVSEEKYRSLIEQASDAIYVIDFEGRFTEVNASLCKMTGYSREELLQLKVEQIIDPENLKSEPVVLGPDDLHTAVMKERRFVKKNGQVFDVEVNVKRFTKDNVLVIARDITNRKVMQAGLREAELKFRTLAEKSVVGVYIVQKGTFIYVNPRFAHVFGYEPDELIGVSSVDVIISEQYKAITLEHVRARLAGEVESINYEVMGIRKDGSNNWVEFYGSRTQIDDEPTIIGSMIDITERKKIEEELRLSEQKYKLLFDSNPLPMWMIAKSDLSIIAVNHAATKHYGYTAEEFLSMTIKDVRPREEWDEMYKGYAEKAPNWGNTITTLHRKKDGSMINVQIFGQDIMYEGRLVRLSIANDITEKLRSEELLQKSEANLQTILNTTDTAYALFDKDLKVLAFNHKAVEFVRSQFNHNPQNGDKLADFFPPERFPQFIEFNQQVLNGQNVSYEVDYVQTDGSRCWFYVRLFPIRDSQENILGLMMALYDITERKNIENNLKVAYERIHNHINRIKNMAWKQSHYMRSPVANLKGLAELLKDNPTDTVTLDYMITELERLDAVIVEMASDAASHD
ncbi:PAS domain S-box-containing protein [Mucilaginibacter gossypiicola]|uniref:histidine kinase n=1 Tax=Mucilaginibacter gossypiicola TaxID=551995 RepID=A0A1H7ZM38_9SPHI|nr:PAS domain S-box protein [Mucilaginibacter gossypiicola]SEM59321.1 PAS domain S-box-containing protein [Mucilaginibacter gossypiicola]